MDHELQISKDVYDGEGIEYNILHVSKAGNLSPRHTNSLKAKRRRFTILCRLKQGVTGGEQLVVINDR